MLTLSTIVRVCIWILGFTNWRLLKHSWAPMSFALKIVANLMCSCLCLLMQLLSYMLRMEKHSTFDFVIINYM